MTTQDQLMAGKSDEYCHCQDVRAGDTRVDENQRKVIHSKLVPRESYWRDEPVYVETACGKPIVTAINIEQD